MIKLLKRAKRLLLLIEDGLLVFMLSAMILMAAGQIVLRNLFDTGLFWADPALRMLVLWLTLLGAIAATRENRHIRIDLLSRFLHARGKAFVQAINDLFSAFICGLISWHASRFVYHEWQDGISLFGGLPAWLGEIIIPIGFGIIALRFLSNLPLRRQKDPGPC